MKFVWHKDPREWKPRKQRFSIGRVFYVPPGSGEMYYLRCLLNIVRGPTSYDEIKCVNGVQYKTYRDACFALGLLDDDKEYIDGITEASDWASANSLRNMFVTLLCSNSFSQPENVWQKCWPSLSDDILHKRRSILKHPGLQLSNEEIKGYALVEVESLMRKIGRTLLEFESIPVPDTSSFSITRNKMINDELVYDKAHMHEIHMKLLSNMTEEQLNVYNTVMNAVNVNSGGVFFVYGYGGTSKTFVWNTLCAAIRSEGGIVLNVASSGIASLLFPGGRTAHSRFSIPINVNEDSTCNIKQGSPLTDLIAECKLIIWDEAPMMHKHCFEALDRSMRDILRFSNSFSCDKPFGGKTTVFGGDFRQILPVIPKGSGQDIVNASINSSYIWRECKVLRLTENMRLQNLGTTDESVELKQFADWIASIGDGTIGDANDGETKIYIPNDILINYSDDPVASILQSTFPSFSDSAIDASFLQGRSILAPTLDVVESVNEYMLSINIAEASTYLSSDSTCISDSNVDILQDVHTPKFLNAIKCSGVPNHVLNLKVDTPVMLLRNIDHTRGLCNGTRLVITRLGKHVWEANVLAGNNTGDKVLIPRMSLTPSDKRLPFKFNRRQFPLIVSYAMTINKSQGQSLSHVGIFLRKPVLSHG